MNSILYIIIFFFGAAIGSFVNVIVDRLYVKSFLTGRSHCGSCNKKLSFFELIPVLSYIFLKGRCGKCKTKIGAKHLYVEIVLGVLALLTYKFLLINYFNPTSLDYNLISGVLLSFLYTFLFILFSVIFLYDLRHKIVPLSFSLLLLITGLAFEVWKATHLQNFYNGNHGPLFYLDLFSGVLIALPFFLINIFTKGRGVGMGDVILFLGVGYLLGFIYGVSAFLLSVWIGALVSLFLIYFLPKKFNKKSAIPFAPFIVIATIIVLFLQIDIVGISMFLQ